MYNSTDSKPANSWWYCAKNAQTTNEVKLSNCCLSCFRPIAVSRSKLCRSAIWYRQGWRLAQSRLLRRSVSIGRARAIRQGKLLVCLLAGAGVRLKSDHASSVGILVQTKRQGQALEERALPSDTGLWYVVWTQQTGVGRFLLLSLVQ